MNPFSFSFEARDGGVDVVCLCVKEKLENEFKNEVETWKKAHYPKSFINFKSRKRASAAFQNAQEPWGKRKAKIIKERSSMLKHTDALQQAQQRLRNGVGETDKNQSVIQKSDVEIRKCQEKLNERVGEMLRYKETYRQEMTLEFERCQAEERERIEFFKQTLVSYCARTDIVEGVRAAREATYTRVNGVNAQTDLDHYSRDFGAGMPMIIPTKMGLFVAEGTVPASDIAPAYTAPPPVAPLTITTPGSPTSASASTPTNVHDARLQPGVRLRALYDYTAQKTDELTFRFDDQFVTVLQTPEVESCWVKVRADGTGVVGLVPGNYVEVDDGSNS